jgi:hypothetical protein
MERRLRLMFDASSVRFGRLKSPNDVAQVHMDYGKHVITLPPGYDDDYTLRLLFHELLHIAMPGELSALGDWEEEFLRRVAEPKMMDQMLRSPRSHEWWLKRLRTMREAQ